MKTTVVALQTWIKKDEICSVSKTERLSLGQHGPQTQVSISHILNQTKTFKPVPKTRQEIKDQRPSVMSMQHKSLPFHFLISLSIAQKLQPACNSQPTPDDHWLNNWRVENKKYEATNGETEKRNASQNSDIILNEKIQLVLG